MHVFFFQDRVMVLAKDFERITITTSFKTKTKESNRNRKKEQKTRKLMKWTQN